jgi:pimeloyl-ACP methyl ester carboxylesterase
VQPALAHEDVTLAGDGATLRGWLFRADPPRRGAIVFLHGTASNREAGLGVAARYVPRGFDVLLYDSRAHGESTGDACTYGYYEKGDLRGALDWLGAPAVQVIGTSLGAAVALQAAAEDPRIASVVSIAVFSDLATVAQERAPFFASQGQIREALAIAEHDGHFRLADVSPAAAAPRLRVPVLVIHGARDRDTRPQHSQRVYEALAGPKRLILVPGGDHNNALDGPAWRAVDEWIEAVGPGPPSVTRPAIRARP